MPSFYIHERVALMATGVGSAPAAALGSLGPDVLYFGSGALRELGRRLHRERTGDFLAALAECCRDDALSRDYARGFLSHYAADSTFHPLVYALSATRGGFSPLRHLAAERALDAWLRAMSGAARADAPDDELLRLAAACLGQALKQWAGTPGVTGTPGGDELAQAFRRCLSVGGVLGALGDVSTGVRAEGGVQLSPAQLQAFAQRGWRDPWTCQERREGPFDLLGDALARGERLAHFARGYWRGYVTREELRWATGDLSYLSGIDWRATSPDKPVG